MTPSAYLCTKCRAIYPLKSGIDRCHKCDLKLTELYDKWQINKQFDDYDACTKILIDTFKNKVVNPQLKKLCEYILDGIKNKVVKKLALKNIKSVTEGDGKKIDKKIIYEHMPVCYYCQSNIMVEEVMVKESRILTCARCRVGLGDKADYIRDQ